MMTPVEAHPLLISSIAIAYALNKYGKKGTRTSSVQHKTKKGKKTNKRKHKRKAFAEPPLHQHWHHCSSGHEDRDLNSTSCTPHSAFHTTTVVLRLSPMVVVPADMYLYHTTKHLCASRSFSCILARWHSIVSFGDTCR